MMAADRTQKKTDLKDVACLLHYRQPSTKVVNGFLWLQLSQGLFDTVSHLPLTIDTADKSHKVCRVEVKTVTITTAKNIKMQLLTCPFIALS